MGARKNGAQKAAAEIAFRLVGHLLIEIEYRPLSFSQLANDVLLRVECVWRVVAQGRLALGEMDHGDEFGQSLTACVLRRWHDGKSHPAASAARLTVQPLGSRLCNAGATRAAKAAPIRRMNEGRFPDNGAGKWSCRDNVGELIAPLVLGDGRLQP